jgi:hypothetical protein
MWTSFQHIQKNKTPSAGSIGVGFGERVMSGLLVFAVKTQR